MATGNEATPSEPVHTDRLTAPAEEKSDVQHDAIDQLQKPNTFGERPPCFRSTVTEVLFVLTTTAAIMASSFLIGILTVNANSIAEDLHLSQAQVSWLTAALTLAGGPPLLFFGRLADLFGRKSLMIISFFVFTGLALGASFSQDAVTIDVLNGFLGLACAAMVTPAAGALGYTYEKPSRRKNLAFACYSAGNPMGFVFGTLFGGLATQIFNWQASYRLVAIIYLFFTIVAVIVVPVDEAEKRPLDMNALKRFDLIGTVLAVGGIGLLTAALTLGGESNDGWSTPLVLSTLIIGFVLFIVFILWEIRYEFPLVPMRIWRDRDFSLLNGILFLGNMGFTTSSFWIALFYQRQGHSPLKVALYLVPMVAVGLLVNLFAGVVLHKISNKLLMLAGTFTFFVSFLLLAVERSGDSYFAFSFPALLIIVIGADLQFNVVNMYVMTSFPRSQQSTAGSIFQTVSRLSTTIGFGLTTSIFNAVLEEIPTTGYYANDPITPYSATFWFSVGITAISIGLVPFLKIGTQGHFVAPKIDEESSARPAANASPMDDTSATEATPSSKSVSVEKLP